jgi:HEPN domain-containing protein
MFPMVICASFSLELYLKCLIQIESGTSEKGHDLEKLFFKLSPESQKMIRTSYEPHKAREDAMFAAIVGVPVPRTDFDFVLHASAKAFEHFRYAFEGIVESGEGWMASPICECARERILELQPDWKI